MVDKPGPADAIIGITAMGAGSNGNSTIYIFSV